MGLWKTLVIMGAVLTSGCVEFWHKDHGIVHEATEKDLRESLPKPTCTSGKTLKWICTDASNPESCHWECRE